MLTAAFLVLAIAAALITLYLVARAVQPLTDRTVVTEEDWGRVEDESAELLAQRDRLVSELKDLELEAALHKIDPQDLARLRGRFEAEALDVVRRLDERAAAYADRLPGSARSDAAPAPPENP